MNIITKLLNRKHDAAVARLTSECAAIRAKRPTQIKELNLRDPYPRVRTAA